jgi:hypothetical protein
MLEQEGAEVMLKDEGNDIKKSDASLLVDLPKHSLSFGNSGSLASPSKKLHHLPHARPSFWH